MGSGREGLEMERGGTKEMERFFWGTVVLFEIGEDGVGGGVGVSR